MDDVLYQNYGEGADNFQGYRVEIFTSPEKGGTGTDGWLNEMAKAFNGSGYTVDGKGVWVSGRSIASSLVVDYITSGKYVPEVFTPSNEMWISIQQ